MYRGIAQNTQPPRAKGYISFPSFRNGARVHIPSLSRLRLNVFTVSIEAFHRVAGASSTMPEEVHEGQRRPAARIYNRNSLLEREILRTLFPRREDVIYGENIVDSLKIALPRCLIGGFQLSLK